VPKDWCDVSDPRVRLGPLDYCGLRGEGSIPVPLPPPACQGRFVLRCGNRSRIRPFSCSLSAREIPTSVKLGIRKARRTEFSPNLSTPRIGLVRHFPANQALIGEMVWIPLAQPRRQNRRTEVLQSGICQSDICRFSQPFMRSVGLHNRRGKGPEMRAFRACDFASRRPVCRSSGGNWRKSPVLFANIPFLAVETSSTTTAAGERCRFSGRFPRPARRHLRSVDNGPPK